MQCPPGKLTEDSVLSLVIGGSSHRYPLLGTYQSSRLRRKVTAQYKPRCLDSAGIMGHSLPGSMGALFKSNS